MLVKNTTETVNVNGELGVIGDKWIMEKIMSNPCTVTDKARSCAFHVPVVADHSLFVGQALLACMHDMLRFNICDLKDSQLCNTVVPNLADQVNKAIPPQLSYACLYWMDHLQHASCTPDPLNEITPFFQGHLPYWLEAISLLSLSSPLSTILSALETCTS